MIYDYQMHKEIEEMIHERKLYEHKYNKGNELIKVQESLNKRIITLKQQLLNDPENPNLNLELGFCESEVERLKKELDEFQDKYEKKEIKIAIHENIMEFNIKELTRYIEYLEELEIDEVLLEGIKNTTESLEDNLAMLKILQK
ncbi:MAG: hypothetical protein IJI98_11700 [Methanosphaera sp.]|nr:hypothetical protein [Methanosphaera sp.]